MGYYELLQDPRWQKKRLEILNRDEWRCQWCGDAEITLHVHHSYYEEGKLPWETDDYFLITLCKDCHEMAHFPKTELEKFLFECVLSRMIKGGEDLKMLNRVIKRVLE